MARTSLHSQEWAKNNFTDHVSDVMIDAPNTVIVDAKGNPRQVRDQVNTLAPLGAVETIMFKSTNLLKDEFGPNEEDVYEIQSKDERVRVVGLHTPLNNVEGFYLRMDDGTDPFVEVTFYGNELNLIHAYNGGATRNIEIVIDGGVPSTIVMDIAANSNILSSREYGMNAVTNVASGLSNGMHSVMITYLTSSASTGDFYGVQIVNSTASLRVNPGSAFSGMSKDSLAAESLTGFDDGVVGIRGARIVKYLKDDAVSQAVQEVDSSQGDLTGTNHSNEEVVRKINFREFGAPRNDGFATLSTSSGDRAYALEDNNTTLVGDNVRTYSTETDSFSHNGSIGDSITLTFTGTGLDFLGDGNFAATTEQHEVYVDGLLTGSGTNATLGWQHLGRNKVVSGLPYGTHTVRIRISATGVSLRISDFLIYGPKKPVLPVGAIELADYNVMADFVLNTSSGVGFISTGTVRKNPTREVKYIGSWNAISLGIPSFEGGFNVSVNSSGASFEYEFFGTGIEYFGNGANNGLNTTIDIDGSSNLSGFTTALVYDGTTLTFTAATGLISGTGSIAGTFGVSVTGLTLGWHKITVTTNNAVFNYLDHLNVITPIHVNNYKSPTMSLKDSRKFNIEKITENGIDLSKAKAWIYIELAGSNTIRSSFNVAGVKDDGTGDIWIHFIKPFKDKNYVVAGAADGSHMVTVDESNNSKFPDKVNILIYNQSGALSNRIFSAVFFGEQEDEGEE